VFGQSSALVVVFVGLLGALALAVPLVVRRREVEARA
jgi:MYXO-CTERM domain-containing protein